MSGRVVGASMTQRVGGRNGNGPLRCPARGEGRGSSSGRRWTSGLAGAFEVPSPVNEDAGDDRRAGDDGHDAHQGGTAGAREGIDLVDAPQ
jgi:hypothetical protein